MLTRITIFRVSGAIKLCYKKLPDIVKINLINCSVLARSGREEHFSTFILLRYSFINNLTLHQGNSLLMIIDVLSSQGSFKQDRSISYFFFIPPHDGSVSKRLDNTSKYSKHFLKYLLFPNYRFGANFSKVRLTFDLSRRLFRRKRFGNLN